ncbi:MAG: carboxypeptidase M32 [Rhodospirillaceae bacterium]|jgi:carboxypeptidase Taq|nr:carboxypeptidase M32 [Rhodospirillaceae bacterium]MBT5945277.1 carboxypeptidase M32 [Rhodospirillaceae bacterium]MBT6403371.1 carboxypeptidase M32 [Rhodospirillaceae bacterium]MBT6535031.1 carboxypeptidase M32 [Rhodospirillaceae bacterium]MBT7363109.1 carboxypeptidase M32 [Rhodospirillaceae bacterium]
MTGSAAYASLQETFRRGALVGDALGILGWDQATIMPEGSADGRAEQIATLSVMRHELVVNPEVSDGIARAKQDFATQDTGDWDRGNLREMERAYALAAALPGDLVEAAARANAVCELQWRGARAENDYASLLPTLREVLNLVRQTADARAEALSLAPYDALLEEYEAGTRTDRLDPLFDRLASFLPEFLPQVLERQDSQPTPVRPEGPFAIADQRALAAELMQALGFDFDRGRLDISHHPFCGGATGDVRITTRYNEDDFTESLMGVLHETGHALYEGGLPSDWQFQPVGNALGMAVHESQSLLIEMQVSRSRPFLNYALPRMQSAFTGTGGAWDVDNIYRLYTRVEPGFIRVDADEVTYPLHVILRYRLERAMLSGDLDLADLPGAWNDAMGDLLGITPPDDRLGCLQDVHWPAGSFGYFPTYTLGAMAAAQFYRAARRDMPDLEANIATGNLAPLVSWLRTHVHGQGSCHTADELLSRATGEPLNPEIFLEHLKARYLGNS